MNRLRNEPALLLAVAAAVVVLGLDLAALSDAVERVLSLLAIVGAGTATRQRVTPVGKQ